MRKVLMHEIDSVFSDKTNREINIEIHYVGANGADYTLCGVGCEEDDRYPASPDYTNKRVTCGQCITVRDYVKGKI